jgi:hypothetical protein
VVFKKDMLNVLNSHFRKYLDDFELVLPFRHLNIKGASASGILYFNESFAKVNSVVLHNKEFKFDDQPLMIVELGEMLLLPERNSQCILPQVDFENMQSWVDNVFKE